MSIATTRGLGDRIAALYAPAMWTIAGFVLYVLAGAGSLLVMSWLGSVFPVDVGAGTPGLSIRNGFQAIVWGALTALFAAPLGRRTVPGIRFSTSGWLTLAAGLLLAAAVITLGEEFVRSRYVYFDPEYQGLTFFTGPAIVAVALATWAALAVPRDGVIAPASAALTAAAGLGMSLLPSIPGAGDGVAAENLPLAGAFAVAVGYALVAVALVVRRLAPPNRG